MARPRRRSSPAAGWRASRTRPIWQAPSSPREKGAFPLFDRQALPGEPQRRGAAERRARGHRASTASATAASPRSRRPAPSRCLPATSRLASSRCSTSYTSAACSSATAQRASETVEDYAHALYRRQFGAAAPLPAGFVTAERARRRASISRCRRPCSAHVDSAISKTINCPEDISLRGLQGRVSRGLRARAQGLHDLSPQRR